MSVTIPLLQWSLSFSLSLLLGLHCCILLLLFYFCFIHSPCFCLKTQEAWIWWDYCDLFKSQIEFSTWYSDVGCFSPNAVLVVTAPPPQIKMPGTILRLWKKGVILGLSPFSHMQVADNNSDYTPSFPNPTWSVFWALSQWSCWHSLKGGGQISWTTSLWTMISIKVIVVAGPCYF